MDKQIEWDRIDLFGEFEDEELENEDDDSSEYIEKEDREMKLKLKKIVQSPLGIFISNDEFHPLRGLPVYQAHLNFPVVKGFIPRLNKVAGIEIFKVSGRYRLLFIFAKMFDIDEVMDNIEAVLGISEEGEQEIIEDTQIPERAYQIFEDVKRHINSEYWIVYIFPNGKYKILNLNNQESLNTEKENFAKLKEMSGGYIFSSDVVEQNGRISRSD